jgi:hypothetical protein
MKKEEKNSVSQNGDQEELLSDSEFGFVYEFFISDKKSGSIRKSTTKDKPQEKRTSGRRTDQSVTFFLPDFFTNEE